MQRFYARVGIKLSGWRTFGLVALGLAGGQDNPAGEYLVWRLSFGGPPLAHRLQLNG